MDINIAPAANAPHITVIAISGRIDSYTIERVAEEIGSLIRIGTNKLICELSGVDFVSGVGLKTFLKAIQDTRKAGGDFKLCALQPPVAKIFQLAGFTDVAPIFADRSAALAAYGVGGTGGAFDKTMVAGPGGGDPYGQTMMASPGGAAFEATMVATPAPGKGFEQTMVAGPAGGKGFEATMLESPGGSGFEKTMLEAPAGKGGDPMQALRDKLRTAAGGGKPKEDDAVAKLREKLASASRGGAAAPAASKVDDKTFQTVMTRIEEIEGTLVVPEKTGAKADAKPGPAVADAGPVVEEIVVRIPTAVKFVEPVSHLVGAAGTLAGIPKMELVKFGVGVVEVLRAVVRHAPKAREVSCRIRTTPGEVSLEIRPDGEAFTLFHVLRPQMESSINSPAAAQEWLEKLATTVAVEAAGGPPTITLTKQG